MSQFTPISASSRPGTIGDDMKECTVDERMEALRYRAGKMAIDFGALVSYVRQLNDMVVSFGSKMEAVLSEIDGLTAATRGDNHQIMPSTPVRECAVGEEVIVMMSNNQFVSATVIDPRTDKVKILGDVYFATVCHRKPTNGTEGHH